MTLAARVAKLEAQAAGRPVDAGPSGEPWRRERAAFVELVPDDLRSAVAARLDGPYGEHAEALASWAAAPLARWAPPPPPGFRLPRALVEWVLAPPRPYWFGHHCRACGLALPLLLVPSGDPTPVADVRAFPACPGCGRPTGDTAGLGPAGRVEGER